jgi:probable phosphoglycerate mutase
MGLRRRATRDKTTVERATIADTTETGTIESAASNDRFAENIRQSAIDRNHRRALPGPWKPSDPLGAATVTLLFLIRHGQSLSNAEHRIQGQADIELSPLGLRQSAALAAGFDGQSLDAIYASPLRRAMQTAGPLATALKLEIRTDDRFKEIAAGIFQGLRWDEINDRFPAEAVRWRAHDPDFVIPGGESRRTVAERGHAALQEIRAAGHKRVAVVAHGGVLCGALKMLLGIPAEQSPLGLYNASISRVILDQTVKLLTLNETAHLVAAGLERPDSTGDF